MADPDKPDEKESVLTTLLGGLISNFASNSSSVSPLPVAAGALIGLGVWLARKKGSDEEPESKESLSDISKVEADIEALLDIALQQNNIKASESTVAENESVGKSVAPSDHSLVNNEIRQKLLKYLSQLAIATAELKLAGISPVSDTSESTIPQVKAYAQAKQRLENLIAATDDIATLYYIWKAEPGAHPAIKTRLKELYPEKIPEGATPWFYVKTVKKYDYLQILWSRTIQEDGESVTEEGSIHLGNVDKFANPQSAEDLKPKENWEKAIASKPQKNTPASKI